MKLIRYISSGAFIFVVMSNINSQEIDTTMDNEIQEVIFDAYIENADENINENDIEDVPLDFTVKKIDINTATADDWLQLGLLSMSQINEIKDYREKHGQFLSIYELSAIKSISEQTLQLILPYLYVTEQIGNPEKYVKDKHEFLTFTGRTIEMRNGFKNDSSISQSSRFAGNAFKVKNRYTYDSQHIYLAILAEKDEGETWFTSTTPAFDFLSGSIEYKNRGIIRQIVVGDYTAQFGQGLALWNGNNFAQNLYSGSLLRFKSGIKPYHAFDENNFMRGIGFTTAFKGFELSFLYSNKYRDASVNSDENDSTGSLISTIQFSGIHALPSQIKNRHTLQEQIVGANLVFERKNFLIGTCGYLDNLSPAVKKSMEPYKAFIFYGDFLQVGSIYARLQFRNLTLYTENAYNGRGIAILAGAAFFPVSQLTLNLLYRKYSPEYYSIYANAYGKNSSVSNETGYCLNGNLIVNRYFNVLFQADIFQYPWLKYRINAPSDGVELYLATEYSGDWLKASVRYRYSKKPEYLSVEDLMISADFVEDKNHKFSIQVRQKINETLSLHSRFDMQYFIGQTHSNGSALLQDVDCNFNRNISLSLRYAIFDTKDWNSRISSYEKNILYTYSGEIFYGKGTRIYLLLKGKIIKQLSYWIKYGVTLYSDRDQISSGPYQINGSRKSDIGIQLIWKY
jgi:hypothetical protein